MGNTQSDQLTFEQKVWFVVRPWFVEDLRATQELRAAKMSKAVAFANEMLMFKAVRGLAREVTEPPPLIDSSDTDDEWE